MQGIRTAKESLTRLESARLNPHPSYMPLFDSRPVLWRNVSALMQKKYGAEKLRQLAREGKFSMSTASRIKAQDTSVGLEIVDRIATVFGVHPWQLLHPDFDVEHPEGVANYSPLAHDLAQQLDGLQSQATREKAHALATAVMTLAGTSTESVPSIGQTPTPAPD